MSDSFLESPQAPESFVALMRSPAVNPERRTIKRKRTQVEAPAPAVFTLYDLWKLSPRGKKKHHSPLGDKIPTYADWLRRCGLKGDAVQRECARAALYWTNERIRIQVYGSEKP